MNRLDTVQRSANVKLCEPQIARAVLTLLFCLVATNPGWGQVHDDTPIELSGFSVSQAYEIQDDQAINLEAPEILRLLYRIQSTSPKSRWEFSQYSKDLSWDDIAQQTDEHRMWVFERTGRLKRVRRIRFSGIHPDAEIKEVFVCQCNDENGDPFSLVALELPNTFPIETDLDEPISFSGFLYARVVVDDTASGQPLFIVNRPAWFPDKESDKANASYVELAQNGVDVGLLDFVKESNAKPLGAHDSEAFFQMIASTKTGDTGEVQPVGFSSLLKQSAEQIGNVIQVNGRVRSCTEITVTDPDIQNRLGLTHYFQLILFPSLDGGKILLEDQSGESQEFSRYPITVCFTSLPKGMTPGEIERRGFIVKGFFFRFWKFQSEKTDLSGKSGLPSPLIIASSLQPIESQIEYLNMLLLAFGFAVVVGMGVLIWIYRRSDQKREQSGESILSTLPDKLDVSGFED